MRRNHMTTLLCARLTCHNACVADVFMFCCLLLTAFALVIEIWRTMRGTEYFWSRILLISGALLVSLTGVFPAREARDNSVEQTTLEGGRRIHTLGIGLGVLIMVHVPEYVWAHPRLRPRPGHEKTRCDCACRYVEAILRSLLPGIGTDGGELLYSIFLWGLIISFAVLNLQEGHSTSNYCAGIADYGNLSRACDLWPQLDHQTCDTLVSEGLVRPNYRCGFVKGVLEDSGWNEIDPERPISGGYCVKKECRLWESTLGVALEFAVLLLALCKFLLIGVFKIESQDARANRAKELGVDPVSTVVTTPAFCPLRPRRGQITPEQHKAIQLWCLLILTALCSFASVGSSTANFEHASNHTNGPEVQATVSQEVQAFVWIECAAYLLEAALTWAVITWSCPPATHEPSPSHDSNGSSSNKIYRKLNELVNQVRKLINDRRWYALELPFCGLVLGLVAEVYLMSFLFELQHAGAVTASWAVRFGVQGIDYCLLIYLVFQHHEVTGEASSKMMFRIMATSSLCWLFMNWLLSWVLPAFEVQTWYASRSYGWFAPLVGYTAFRCRLVSFFLHKALHGQTKPYPGYKCEQIFCQSVQMIEDGGEDCGCCGWRLKDGDEEAASENQPTDAAAAALQLGDDGGAGVGAASASASTTLDDINLDESPLKKKPSPPSQNEPSQLEGGYVGSGGITHSGITKSAHHPAVSRSSSLSTAPAATTISQRRNESSGEETRGQKLATTPVTAPLRFKRARVAQAGRRLGEQRQVALESSAGSDDEAAASCAKPARTSATAKPAAAKPAAATKPKDDWWDDPEVWGSPVAAA